MKKSVSTNPTRHIYTSADSSSDFLKERLFGLSNPQGNHGEGVREAHFHVDNTPVSSRPWPQEYLDSGLPLTHMTDCNRPPTSCDVAAC